MSLPTTHNELMEDLEQRYPLRNVSPKQNVNEIMYLAGQRSVVEYLAACLADEED